MMKNFQKIARKGQCLAEEVGLASKEAGVQMQGERQLADS